MIIAMYFFYKKISCQKNKFKLISAKRYLRYVKLIIRPYVIIIIIIFSSISYLTIKIQENEYEEVYKKEGDIGSIMCIVESNREEKEYYARYKVKVIKSDTIENFKQKCFYVQVKKNSFENLKYGDMIKISGKYIKPETQRNYGGFDYQKYLKTKNIYGTISVSNIVILANRKANVFMMIANDIFLNIKNNMDKVFKEGIAEILKGLLLGDSSNIEEDIKENFRNASMSHILAISGMHISYVIIGIDKLLSKRIGKRSTKIVIIIILIIYMFITGFSPSIIRATVMGILVIISNLVYRKNDIWTSISISLFVILIYNPYSIMNIGLQLSYLGIVGIIVFQKSIFQVLDNVKLKKKKYKKDNQKKTKIIDKVEEILSVSISAQIMIFPILLYHFNTFNPYFILSSFFISIIMEPIIILGFIFIIFSFISIYLSHSLSIFLDIGLQILMFISNMGKLPFSKIYIATPSSLNICIYFIMIVIFKHLYLIYHSKQVTTTQKRLRNLIALLK